MKLTDKACKAAAPKEKPYKVFDGGGLFLLVNATGSKLWRLKYRFGGKEKLLAIGPYPLVTLAEARERRDAAKKLLLSSPPIDPGEHKSDLKRAIVRDAENSFQAVALEWIGKRSGAWSDGYKKKILKILNKNVFPYIGADPVNRITPSILMNKCLERIEERGALEIAGRTRNICSQIFDFAIQTERCEANPASNLKGAVKTYKTEHFRAIDIKDLPKFLYALERNEARIYERTRRAVWLSLYTFCRPVEIRTARWEDVDLDEALWMIPAAKMKMRRDHMVPLSRQAIALLREQKEEVSYFRDCEWVFPSQVRPRMPMSDGTVNKAIQRLGFGNDMVAHGFRALARTTIREKLGYHSEVIEKQLAHQSAGPLGEAYDRTQFLDERVKMMQDWADFIDDLPKHRK